MKYDSDLFAIVCLVLQILLGLDKLNMNYILSYNLDSHPEKING